MVEQIRRTIVVTGATSGIGEAAALEFARQGHRVIAVGRNPGKIAASKAKLEAGATGAPAEWVQADFASLSQVARASREIADLAGQIDVLVNNAGNHLTSRTVTEDGFETTWQVNHLAPFLMTSLLLPNVLRSAEPKVITLSSIGHAMIPDMIWDDLQGEHDFNPFTAYCQSKLANVLFTRELARRNADTALVASAVHPGMVASDFPNKGTPDMIAYYSAAKDKGEAISPESGADTVMWLAGDHSAGQPSGGYFFERARIDPSEPATNPASAERLWHVSEQQVARFL